MMNNELEETYKSRYELIYPEFHYRNRCFYCGDYADIYDYFPALQKAHLYRETSPHYKVPSCKECCGLLKNKVQESLKERREVVQQLLRIRHKKIIANGMQWSEKEIGSWENDDSKSSLLRQVKATREKYFILKERISFKGYEYEYNGGRCEKGEVYSLPNITINDVEYPSIEDAVLNLSKQLNVNSNKIYGQLAKGTSLQSTYNFLEQEKTINLEIRKLAKKYPHKNKHFFKSAIAKLSKQYEEYSLYEVIEFFEVNYLMSEEESAQYKNEK